MTDSFEFKVGPPDDAENFIVMNVGLQARKNALHGLKKVQAAILKADADLSAKEGVSYAWQGMISQAAYTIVLTNVMLTSAGLKHKGEEFDVDLLVGQVRQIALAFVDNMNQEGE